MCAFYPRSLGRQREKCPAQKGMVIGMKKVLLGMSGGVDSTYAVHLLKEQGYYVEGVVLRMHDYTEVEEAKAAAEALAIPLQVICVEKLFEEKVIEDFCDAYRNARTPNPCIVCNEHVKFRALYEEAMRRGFDAIATGHYARVVQLSGRYAIAEAKDLKKDQSYMLYRLPQEILARLLLPLGDCTKTDVVAQASELRLAVAHRPESQEICFVKEDYADYIEKRCGPSEEGFFVNEQGSVIGQHRGIIRYTVGQRKGLGVSASTRLFVKEIQSEDNVIVLAPSAPTAIGFTLERIVFSGASPEDMLFSGEVKIRVRYQAALISATMTRDANGAWQVSLKDKAVFVTAGQSAVVYRDGIVLCGGFISRPNMN